MYMTRKRYISLILILGSLTALSPFSIDMYLPGFPAIAKDLHTTDSKVSLSLTGFFIGIALGQLLYGPLLDRFGRKKPLYFGLSLYILASIGCSMAHDINILIVWRCIQAIGSCAAMVTAMTMVRDLFPIEDNAKVFALLILVLGTSPLVAPTVGGYITAAWGWSYVFIVLAIIGAVIFIASAIGLPNSYQPDPSISLKPAPILRSFATVITEPQFYTYALTGSIAFAGLFAYVSGSPLVFMNVFSVNEKTYGWIFAFLSIGFIASSQMNTLLLRRFTSQQIVQAILICYMVLGLAFITLSLTGLLTMPVAIVFLFLLLACVGITNPNATALSLAPFSKNAGTASAVLGALQMGLGAFASAMISLFEKPSTNPMAMVIAISATLGWLVLMVGRQKITRPATIQKEEMAGSMH
jgi:DHA1 family bicyclomycin/chloramphenicol resistance-like MFS transporter